MKTYEIEVRVNNVEGWQYFNVDAESKEEALSLHQSGHSKLTDEVLDVTGIECAELSNISEL